MLLLTGFFVALIAMLIIARLRGPRRVNPAKLGWMSEKWLAEHRATRRGH
jgi:hypothetical protein